MNKQREIKFKTWDKESKEMSEVFDLAHADCYVNPFSEDPIMQYTGMKDKNGIEIYEGDIVKIHWAAIELPMWDKKAVKMRHQIDYYLEIKYTNYGFRPYWNNTLWFDWKYLWWNKCEVIGNIYENKNLLK